MGTPEFNDLIKDNYQLIYFILTGIFYITIHFFIIQLKRTWKNQSVYEKTLTIISILLTTFFCYGNMSNGWIPFMLGTYIFVHFFIIQFKRTWKKRSVYEKIISVLYPLIWALFIMGMISGIIVTKATMGNL